MVRQIVKCREEASVDAAAIQNVVKGCALEVVSSVGKLGNGGNGNDVTDEQQDLLEVSRDLPV